MKSRTNVSLRVKGLFQTLSQIRLPVIHTFKPNINTNIRLVRAAVQCNLYTLCTVLRLDMDIWKQIIILVEITFETVVHFKWNRMHRTYHIHQLNAIFENVSSFDG